MNVADALTGLKAFVSPPRPDMRTYVNGSQCVMLAVIVTIAIVPDGFLFWMLMPRSLWWIVVILGVLEVWTSLWLFALYGSMVARPHEISGERIVLHNGMLGRVELEPKEIAAARSLGVVKRRALPRRRGDGSSVLAFGGVPVVEVELKSGRKIFVASDAPQVLCDALLAH